MTFHLRPYLERARNLIDKHGDDPFYLTYAALELRFGIERVCYEMLRLRLGYMSIAELRDWKPQKVVMALEELADPLVTQNAVLNAAFEKDGEPENWHRVAERKMVPANKISKWWNKLRPRGQKGSRVLLRRDG